MKNDLFPNKYKQSVISRDNMRGKYAYLIFVRAFTQWALITATAISFEASCFELRLLAITRCSVIYIFPRSVNSRVIRVFFSYSFINSCHSEQGQAPSNLSDKHWKYICRSSANLSKHKHFIRTVVASADNRVKREAVSVELLQPYRIKPI